MRRFVISAPRDNMTEAFRFSSRHSEFIKLKAEALLGADFDQQASEAEMLSYKIVMQYPDRQSFSMML